MQRFKYIYFLFLATLLTTNLNAQNVEVLKSSVSGVITEAATGKALAGIRVSYKQLSASITDATGTFTLKIPSQQVAIIVEGDGFQTKEIALKGLSKIEIALYEDTYTSFYDVAQHPEGQIMKNKTPFAISSVQTNGNWANTTETPTSFLQGKVAGLHVTRRSGNQSIGGTMRIRGINSLYGTNQPLIVIDGVIFNNQDIGGSIISNHYTDPLSTIDVRDIDNISVLKDGSSLYGTKGANGVILITTARAKELGTKIDFAAYSSFQASPKNIPVLSAADYRTYVSEILKSRGFSDASIQALPYMNDNTANPDYYRYHNNTDWQNNVTNNSMARNVYLKVTGGDNIAKYALSLGYLGGDGIVKNTNFSRYNMRFNADLNLSKRMSAITNLSFTFSEQNLRDGGFSPKTNPIFLGLSKSPLLRIFDVSNTGIESPSLADRDTFNISNPAVITNLAKGVNKNYRFFGTIGFNYLLSKTLTVSTTLGITNDKVRESFFIPRKGVTSDTLNTDIVFSRLGNQVNSLFSLFNDSRISFNKSNNKNNFSSTLGVRYMLNKTEQDYGLGYNSAIDELISVGNGVNSLRKIGGAFGEANWLNFYLNANYEIADKYFLSFNAAMDGSSRFGKNIADAVTLNGNKYAFMPSIAAAWLVSSENFMKGKGIDLLKLRASYGLSGNDDIGNYAARTTYTSQNLLGVQGLVRNGFGNNQLQWEQTKKLNFGVDASILNERVSLSFDVFKNKSDKIIAYEEAPVASGFSYAINNSAAISNSGIELAINSRIINNKYFKWDLGFIFSNYKTTVDNLPFQNLLSNFGSALYSTQIGSAPNLFYGFSTAGVFNTDLEAAASGLAIRNPDGSLKPFKGGDMRFADLNGDKVIDDKDRNVIGNPNPDFAGSITSKVQYKKFTLDLVATFVQGNDIFNYTRQQLESMNGFENQTQAVLNRWRSNSNNNTMPKASWGDPMGNARFSDRWIENGSYFRLRTLNLSYDFSVKPGFVKYTMLYLTANNLFTLTNYKGYDPEFSASESIFGMGVDNALVPITKSMQLGVRIGL